MSLLDLFILPEIRGSQVSSPDYQLEIDGVSVSFHCSIDQTLSIES